MSVLAVDGLDFAYPNGRDHGRILRGARFRLQTGEILGILGRNGCGKSTLFQCLVDRLRPPWNALTISGEYVPETRRMDFFSYLPQSDFLPMDLCAEATARMLIRDPEKRKFVTADVRIRSFGRRRIGTLSGGERRYLGVLLILALGRRFTLLDEPYAEIEPLYRDRINAALRDAASWCGIAVTDHDHRTVRSVCTRLGVMRGGELHDAENTDKSLAQYGYFPAA